MLKSLFSPSQKKSESVAISLGPLERKVMQQVWAHGKVSVRDVFLALGESWAYTTVLTTLERLYKKGFLAREKDGKAFFYSSSCSHQELEQGHLRATIDSILGWNESGTAPILATIVDTVSEHDRSMLDELDRLIQQKRLALQNAKEEENV